MTRGVNELCVTAKTLEGRENSNGEQSVKECLLHLETFSNLNGGDGSA